MRWTRGLVLSATLTVIGYGGLRIGFAFHPESNLLGGFALLFAPIYWLGLVCLMVFGIGWTIVTTMAALHRRHS